MCCASMFKQMAVGDGGRGALELEATADTVGSQAVGFFNALGLFRLYTHERRFRIKSHDRTPHTTRARRKMHIDAQ